MLLSEWTCEKQKLLFVVLLLYLIAFFRRFDCVFPTRTARFGVALVPAGSIRLKAKDYADSFEPVDADCSCLCCREYTRAYLHTLFKNNCPLAGQLLTMHNIAYMMRLMRSMREVGDPLTTSSLGTVIVLY